MKTGSVSSGSAANVVWFGTLAGVIHRQPRPDTLENRNDAQPAPSACVGFSMPFASVPKLRGSLIVKSGDFRPNLTKATV
jgi:hypothetical protein